MGALGDLLELLHRAGERLGPVHATLRQWEAGGPETQVEVWRDGLSGAVREDLLPDGRPATRYVRTRPEEPGGAYETVFQPLALLTALALEPAGTDEVAGRPAVLADGRPRPALPPAAAGLLHGLGIGADTYRLAFDAEHGVLLRCLAERDGECIAGSEFVTFDLGARLDPHLFAQGAPVAPDPGAPATLRLVR